MLDNVVFVFVGETSLEIEALQRMHICARRSCIDAKASNMVES